MDLQLTSVRVPAPWPRTRPGSSWHHIIPCRLLRTVWNRLAERHISTQLPEAKVALRQFVLLGDRELPGAEALIDRMRAADTTRRRASHHTLAPLEVPEFNTIATAVIWPAWNSVEGPGNRSDDPEDARLDLFHAGLTAEEAARMRVIEILHDELQMFLKAGPLPDPGFLRYLADAVSSARPFLAGDKPIPYRESMWVREPDGRWRKRLQGEQLQAAGAG